VKQDFLAIIIRSHRSRPTTHVKMRPIVTDRVAWSVGLLVCQCHSIVSPAETAQPIEMPCGLCTRVGPRKHY